MHGGHFTTTQGELLVTPSYTLIKIDENAMFLLMYFHFKLSKPEVRFN